mmetsp:Transcript_24797/g.52848  ORF Transcript_24797/g.52848 Transcript_24797/m.52848 type:complete len:268 (-) Transcript_24797:87-890(-)
MEEVGHHHEAEFGILVGLRADETIPVRHGDGVLKASFEPVKLLQVGDGVDPSTPHGVIVSSDGADHDHPRIGCLLHAIKKSGDHEEVRKVVDLHRLFMSVDAPLGMGQRRLIHSSIAKQSIDRLAQLILLELVAKFMNAGEGIELAVHDVKVIHVETIDLGHGLHLVHVTYGPNHEVFIGGEEILDRLAAEPGGAAGDHNQFLIAEPFFRLSSLHFLGLRQDLRRLPVRHEFEGVRSAASGDEREEEGKARSSNHIFRERGGERRIS